MSQGKSHIIARLVPARTTQDGPGRLGFAGSVLLHLAVIGATLLSFQHHFKLPNQGPPVIPVDLITIGPKTNLRQVAPKPQKVIEKQPQPIKAQPVKTANPPLPEATRAPSVPLPIKMPKLKMAPAKPVSVKAPEFTIKAPTPHVVPHERPRPATPHQHKAKNFNINSVLALLNKEKPSPSTTKGITGAQPHRGFGAETAMTVQLSDALRSEIAPCWSPPVDAPDPSDLVVEFELFLNPDGSVARPPQLAASSAAAAESNSYTRAAAEAARRAIYTCAPYKLPANQYNQWRDIEIQFDPRQMMGAQ